MNYFEYNTLTIISYRHSHQDSVGKSFLFYRSLSFCGMVQGNAVKHLDYILKRNHSSFN